jgi:lipoprotein-releasing system ATP-binding protein
MLVTKNIVKKYGDLSILENVNMEVKKAEIVAVVGASGAGKSTLLHIIGTLDKPDSGSVTINNIDVFALKGNQLATFRNQHIGFIFQFHHLLPEFTALENVCMPAWISGISKTEVKKNAENLLIKLSLKNRMQHKPNQLSGGEQQRVAIARALINNPSIVLADEPTGNLDTTNSNDIFEILKMLRDDLGQTFIMVTHNDELAHKCDKIFTMKDGTLLTQ